MSLGRLSPVRRWTLIASAVIVELLRLVVKVVSRWSDSRHFVLVGAVTALLFSVQALGMLALERSLLVRPQEVVELRAFLRPDPVSKAKAALGRGDTRLLGVAGYTITVPGVDESRCMVPREKVVVVPGTSDVLLTEEHARLNTLAHAFAQRYNAEILRHLRTTDVVKCN